MTDQIKISLNQRMVANHADKMTFGALPDVHFGLCRLQFEGWLITGQGLLGLLLLQGIFWINRRLSESA
jgi:hypothetical protein